MEMPGLAFIFIFAIYLKKKKRQCFSQLLFYLNLKNKKKEKKAVTLSFLGRPLREKCTPVSPGPALVAKGNILTKQNVLYKMYVIHILFQLFPQVRS